AYRAELLTRGLTAGQIDRVAEGKYVSEIDVSAPREPRPSGAAEPALEVQELKVELGQQVQAGQMICLVSNHQLLYIEGRAFSQETPLLEKALKEDEPVQVEFLEEETSGWPPLKQTFTIRHIANTIDTASRTFAFYIPLVNQSRRFMKD